MKKIFIDAYLAKNLGDDLFLKIVFERYPNVEWHFTTTDKTYRETFSSYPNVVVHYDNLFHKIVNRINYLYKKRTQILAKKYDALLKIGGSIFIQSRKWNKQVNQNHSLIQSFKNNNRPVFILGSNFGPYAEEEYLEAYKEIFQLCDDICFREQYSYNLFRNLPNVRVAPDIVFSMKYENKNKKENTVGISVIDISDREELAPFEKNYLKKNAEMIKKFVTNGYQITLFSFCELQNDTLAIKKILDLLDENLLKNVRVVNYTGNIEKFLNEFSSMESIIGCRFHSVILAFLFNQNFYPLIYSNKTYNVLKDLNLDKDLTFIKNIDQLNVDTVFKTLQFNKLNDGNIFKEAEKQFMKLDEYISQ